MLVRPHHFRPNPQTAADNAFQSAIRADPDLTRAASEATTRLAERLTAKGVDVDLFEDDGDEHPDSVFPNNWFSTHEDGRVVVYPHVRANRRGEPRPDIIDRLQQRYRVAEVIDLAGLAAGGRWLEGTGAMVLDRVGRVAYVARSLRADPDLAGRSLTRRQKRKIERSCELVPVDIAPVETAGGSVRCMIAGIHLAPGAALQPA